MGREHQVVATVRSPEKAAAFAAAGATPTEVDGLDPTAVRRAVVAALPDVVVHQTTALTSVTSLRNLDAALALTNRLRTEGTAYLLSAVRVAGARRFVAQSFTGWPNARESGRVKTEDDPLDADPAPTMVRTLDAIRLVEGTVLGASDLEDLVLRYGAFYVVDDEPAEVSVWLPELARGGGEAALPHPPSGSAGSPPARRSSG